MPLMLYDFRRTLDTETFNAWGYIFTQEAHLWLRGSTFPREPTAASPVAAASTMCFVCLSIWRSLGSAHTRYPAVSACHRQREPSVDPGVLSETFCWTTERVTHAGSKISHARQGPMHLRDSPRAHLPHSTFTELVRRYTPPTRRDTRLITALVVAGRISKGHLTCPTR